MKSNYSISRKSHEEVLKIIRNSKGECILNCSFCDQKALKIVNGVFVVQDIAGYEWTFDNFEQVCYFMVASAGYDYETIKDIEAKTKTLFPKYI